MEINNKIYLEVLKKTRCLFCGKSNKQSPLNNFCSEKCFKKMNKFWDKKQKEGVCVSCSGEVSDEEKKKQKFHRPICINCKADLNSDLQNVHTLLKGGKKN